VVDDGKDSALTNSPWVRFPPVVGDNAAAGHAPDDWAWTDAAPAAPSSGTLYNDTANPRHNEGANATFVDGHAKWFQITKLTTACPSFNDCLWLPY
jgi:prepilin-type processing-associated H-X9-DG protein